VLRLFPAVIIFFGSYCPLFLIILAQGMPLPEISFPCGVHWGQFPEINIRMGALPSLPFILFLLSFICVVLTFWFLQKQKLSLSVEILDSKPMATELMSYALPYVVSFMGLDFSDQSEFIGFVIFLAWMFVLIFRSGQILMNPALIIFGYRLHEVRYQFIGDDSATYTTSALHRGRNKFVIGKASAKDIENMLIVKERLG
jgi:hypothetical protein